MSTNTDGSKDDRQSQQHGGWSARTEHSYSYGYGYGYGRASRWNGSQLPAPPQVQRAHPEASSYTGIQHRAYLKAQYFGQIPNTSYNSQPISDDAVKPMSSSPPPPLPPLPPAHVLAHARRKIHDPDQSVKRAGYIRQLPPKKSLLHKPVPKPQVKGLLNISVSAQGSILKLVQETIRDQDRLVKKRIAAANRRNDLKAQLPLFMVANRELTEIVDQITPVLDQTNASVELKARFSQAWAKSQELSNTIQKWAHLLEGDEDSELLILEGKCLANQEELSKLVNNLVPRPSVDRCAHTSETLTETLAPTPSHAFSITSSSSGSTITIRQRYYKTIGTMNLLRDRIFNLDSELEIQKREREIDREAGEIVPAVDDDLEAEYRRRRIEIIEDYWANKKEMAHALQVCRDGNIRVRPANLPPHLDQLFQVDYGRDSFSEASMSIIRWIQQVKRALQSEEAETIEPRLLDKEIEGVLRFPSYQLVKACTERDRLTFASSSSQSSLQPPSFSGDMPTAGRRYSAPMLLEHTARNQDTPALDYQNLKTRKLFWKSREDRLGQKRADSEY